jgi:hypothetical protein
MTESTHYIQLAIAALQKESQKYAFDSAVFAQTQDEKLKKAHIKHRELQSAVEFFRHLKRVDDTAPAPQEN